METEIWKSHPDIPWVEVSTFGRVRTLDRLESRKNRTYSKKGHILKQYETACAYLQVSIKVDGKWTKKYVHRLVAQTYIPNPDNLPQVNHLDCNRKNNNIENLEFCTASYNNQYREKYGTPAKDFVQKSPVFAVNLSTLEVSRFESQIEASRVLGLKQPSVNAVIKGRYKSTGGYLIVKDDAINRKLHDIGGVGLKIK